MAEYPNFKRFEAMMDSDFVRLHPEFVKKMLMKDFCVEMFPQSWGSAAGAFAKKGMVAESAITMQYTTVMTMSVLVCVGRGIIEEYAIHGVFFGNEAGYLVEHPTDKFFDDVKSHQLRGKFEDLSVYCKNERKEKE